MKKKFIFFALILSVLCIGGGKINSLNAQETIVGNGEADPTYNIPSNFYHNYSFTQQIYTSEQLGFGKGVISDIAFFRTDSYGDITRNYDVYMVNTSKESFTGGDWVTVNKEDIVFSGDITFKSQSWNVIDIKDFEYNGENILICIDDNTGGYWRDIPFKENTTSDYTTIYYCSDNNNPSPTSPPSQGLNYMKRNNQIKVTYTPHVTVRPSSIDFGERASGAWAEPKTIQIDVLQNTTITDIESPNTFFVIPDNIDYLNCTSLEITTGEGDAGEKTGKLVITYNGGSVEVPMTATAYIPTDDVVVGDVVEEVIGVTFTDNAFSHHAESMHDDYILPGETVDGNLNDAVYTFTLEEAALITATVEGTNPIVAIYDEDFDGEGGPSSDNNNPGGQSGPTAPTTFSYDFNDGDLSDFILIEKDTETAGKHNHTNNWEIISDGPDKSNCLISYSYKSSPSINNANNYVVTKEKYKITANSKLTFDARNHSSSDPDYLKVEVSADGENFKCLTKVTPGMGSWLEVNVDLGVLLMENGLQYGEYHIALHHDENYHMYIMVDNLQLTDGSSKSRTGEPQIDGVLYPAGIYYLVAAAAESDFTLNLSILPAPKQFAYTSPEDGATEQDNPVLTWESAEYASSYDVYLGTTSNTLTKVDTDITETSFQTTGLGLSNNTKYYWQVVAKNSVGETRGGIYSFVTPLDIPQNVRASSNEIYPDNNGNNNVTIEWDVITGVEGYNVYVKFNGEGNAIKHNGNKLVTATSYDLLKMDYSKNGHVVYVKAVYEIEGETYESNMSATQTIKVTDYTTLSVTVEDANGDQIDGAKIVLQGKDEFGKDINYNNLENGTYENGTYTLEVLPGTYTATITKLDYNDVVVEVTLSYTESNTLDVVMQSKPSAPFTVNAEEGSASWEANYSSYNVYRRDGEGNVTSLATGVTAKQYQDTDWESLANGEYEYGVSAMIDADLESRINWSYPVEKGGITFTGKGDWNTAANWNTNTVPNTEDKVTIKGNATITEGVITVGSIRIASGATLTVNSGGVLNVTNGIINTNAAALVMEDGAQIIQPNSDVAATFNMKINNPTEWSNSNTTGWQFIASPFTNASISNFTNNIEGNYDLYKYDGNKPLEWVNQKDVANSGANSFEEEFVNGRAYLASYQTETTATFSGTLNNATSFPEPLSLSYIVGNDLANFHLLGNPFSFDMDWSKASKEYLVEGYAVINAEGNGYEYLTSGTIPVGDGFFVKTTKAGASFSYNHNVRGTRGEDANSINVIATSNAGSDNVIIRFAGKEEGFNKLQNFDEAIAIVYVSENGTRYGIYNCEDNVQEIALNFDAKQMGNYSISLDINGKFENVTLVDRFTGIETNMLIEDKYSFTATSNDSHERFFIRLDNGQESTDNSHFVYKSGEELILTIEGSVQIVDLLGRIVYSNDVVSDNNRIDVSNFNNGTYVVRVINETGVKVEKVVIY